jgi:alginate O-acetyltransferase complex protein AlgI
MLFNSVPFAIFLPAVFILYWSLQKAPLRLQNIFVILASYFFYGWWDWRFLGLIVVSSATDYFCGLLIHGSNGQARKKGFLLLSLLINLGLLGFFKYWGFFVESFAELLAGLGISQSIHTLKIVLPIGISFYTFQTLSYTIDIYRGRIKPTRDPFAFFAFVSFFPQLVAGPIERASSLLPQFLRRRSIDYDLAHEGLQQILWGMWKKVAVADVVAISVNYIYLNSHRMDGLSLWIGSFLFGMQIYCDFSGYSDIAIGTAKLFGFRLMRNFALPYFSRDIPEFWRRWHISLTTWFRDYVFIPLCGGAQHRPGRLRRMGAVLATFALSGLWHGAAWHFVAWGVLHGLFYLPGMAFRRRRLERASHPGSGGIREWISIAATFLVVTFAWIFFRSQSLSDAIVVVRRILDPSLFVLSRSIGFHHYALGMLPLCFIVLAADWFTRNYDCPLRAIARWWRPIRWLVYTLVIWSIFYHLPPPGVDPQQFIYFQF